MYNNISDAALLHNIPALANGPTKIWYFNAGFEKMIMGYENAKEFYGGRGFTICRENLHQTHSLLGDIKSEDFEEIFSTLQGEIWSPQGEARPLILSRGLSHTSMSVGDIIELKGEAYFCDIYGWIKLPHSSAGK